jgi:Dimerisation domain of Ca+-activated chloride-channel, anoctamin
LFRDGIRSIDLVLAFEEGDLAEISDIRRRDKRHFFQQNLVATGLQLEFEAREV